MLTALDGINLSIRKNEFIAIIGPSGCGKSTLFNILAGISRESSGSILINGEALTDRRGVTSYMPQDNALLPWRRVLDNAILGLEMEGVDRKRAREEARALLGLFGLEGFESAYVWQLSGGMRQRVALMRTLLKRKEIILLDEPFGALDALTRNVMQNWMLKIRDSFQGTFVLVTHDIEEAILLADRIYVMSARPGKIIGEVAVNLSRPRKKAVEESPEFNKLKLKITTMLHGESLKALKQQHDFLDINQKELV